MLQQLHLRQFRNYEKLDAELYPGINLVHGANGQGKTNLLEAVYFLSLLRSFRTAQVRDLCRWGQRSFILRARVGQDPTATELGVEHGESRRLRVNGERISRASEFISRYLTVAFIPEDIDLVKGPASGRRRFLDITLTQLTPVFMTALQEYNHALRSRNQLLRTEAPAESALGAFEEILAGRGAELVRQRHAFFAALQPHLEAAAEQIMPAGAAFALRYQPSIAPTDGSDVDELREHLLQAFAGNRRRDLSRGLTTAGPHRDDFGLVLDGKRLANYGSEGQCRLAAMTLKLAKSRLMQERNPRQHVVTLVDDVIGELDARGRHAFFSAFGEDSQVLVAATDPGVLASIPTAQRLAVADGTVQPG